MCGQTPFKMLDVRLNHSIMILVNGQTYTGQVGKWPWHCTTTSLNKFIELGMEKNQFSNFRDLHSWQVLGPWVSPYSANGQITVVLHNYRSKKFPRTLHEENPFSSSFDMYSAKSGPATHPTARSNAYRHPRMPACPKPYDSTPPAGRVEGI